MHEPDGYDCPFCRIAGGTFPGRVVYRDGTVMVLVNIKWWPNNSGSALVVPVEHHENLYELPPSLGTPLQQAIRDTALAMKSAFGCDGVSTRQHNEPAGNQDVWHYHVHVFPRYTGDDLYGTRGEVVDMAKVERMTTLLRKHYPEADARASLPGKQTAAGSLLFDERGRVLIVLPTYRDTWGIPGGGIERGESPLEGCRREILEELGLAIEPGALLCVDHRHGIDALRFIFTGPVLSAEQIGRIALPPDELREHRFVTVDEAIELLDPPLARRVAACLQARATYLEDGKPV